jgi:hypothetical protein
MTRIERGQRGCTASQSPRDGTRIVIICPPLTRRGDFWFSQITPSPGRKITGDLRNKNEATQFGRRGLIATAQSAQFTCGLGREWVALS